MHKRKKFTKEFKLEALRVMEESGKPASDVARELGIRRNQLYKWQEKFRLNGNESFPGSGRRPAKDDEVARLKRELERVKEERDTLKKAAQYFARELG